MISLKKLLSLFNKKKDVYVNTVLIVDDNDICLKTQSIIVDNLGLGFDVVTTKSGIKALDLIKKNNFKFILLDLTMPDLDGLKILKILNDYEDKNRKIIIISSNSRYYLEDACKVLNSAGFLTKPLNAKELLKILKNKMEK